MLKLYSYFRSSASYRARIALHWKNLKFEYIPVHLVKNGGEQNQPEFRRVNPMGHVPALDHDGFLVAESTAIIQYLDDVFPERPLIPHDPKLKARTIQIAELVNSGIQPLQNLKILRRLEVDMGLGKPAADAWVKHWIEDGFQNLEKILATTAGQFAVGDQVTMADCFLIPQCFACRRFGVKVEDYPHLARIEANSLKLEAFQKSHPEKQPDYSA